VKREIKEKYINQLAEAFREQNTFYLLEFNKMPVSQSVELRKLLRRNSYSFRIVKNRLALRALPEGIPEGIRCYFRKTTAIAFAAKNPIGLARLLKDFSGQGKTLAVKGGVVEGQLLSAERFSDLARLTSREDLLGKIGYLMAYPLIKFQTTWQASLSRLGRLLSQLKSKK
jgi:large subunit ribosomal protein L10